MNPNTIIDAMVRSNLECERYTEQRHGHGWGIAVADDKFAKLWQRRDRLRRRCHTHLRIHWLGDAQAQPVCPGCGYTVAYCDRPPCRVGQLRNTRKEKLKLATPPRTHRIRGLNIRNSTMTLEVYQARDGKIYLRNGVKVAPLTKQQIFDLHLDIFRLEDFDFGAYKAAYHD